MRDVSSAIEAILFAAGEAFSISRMSLILGADVKEVELAAAFLQNEYKENRRGMRILRLDDKLQMCSSPEYAQIISLAMEQRKPPALSQSALETLAVVAYFQPVTRAYIDQVRGVDSSYTVSSLAERGLIEICGKLDVPGRPAIFRTTDVFLRTMGISSLDELPELPDMNTNDGVDKLKSEIERLRSGDYHQITINDLPENKDEE